MGGGRLRRHPSISYQIHMEKVLIHITMYKNEKNYYSVRAVHPDHQYLEKTKINTASRAMVAHTIGQIYMELSNCQEGLIWLFQAEEEETTYHRADELKKHIDTCLATINSLEPNNLNAK